MTHTPTAAKALAAIAAAALLAATTPARGQEILTGISHNPFLEELAKTSDGDPGRAALRNDTTPLPLPFFDDFSSHRGHPAASHWSDSAAYVNSHFCQTSVTIGVATLDCLDSRGQLYRLPGLSPYGPADTLTSRPIDLATTASDSLYLSFFHQSGGLGDAPEAGDSLIVDFYDGQAWHTVWSAPGRSQTDWRQTLLPIREPQYLHRQFRFRFRNTVSPSAGDIMATNCDIWNLDYVLLDRGRTATDTTVRDVAFIRPPGTALSQFSSMPWAHYKLYSMFELGNIDFHFANRDAVDNQNITIYYKVSGEGYADSVLIGANNYPACSEHHHSEPVTRVIFPTNSADSAEFLLETKLTASSAYPRGSNTAGRTHKFADYYAYDDGTAENGYDVNLNGGRVAVKYETYAADTLLGADIYFNISSEEPLTNYFELCVWADDGGSPGALLHSEPGFYPTFSAGGEFTRLRFQRPVRVSGKFFIGWTKKTPRHLSVGYDRNTTTTRKNFYNLGHEWVASGYHDALMIRPVFGRRGTATGTDDPAGEQADAFETPLWHPNPVADRLHISYPRRGGPWTATLTDLAGRTVAREVGATEIDCGKLPPGIYILTLKSGRKQISDKITIY